MFTVSESVPKTSTSNEEIGEKPTIQKPLEMTAVEKNANMIHLKTFILTRWLPITIEGESLHLRWNF